MRQVHHREPGHDVEPRMPEVHKPEPAAPVLVADDDPHTRELVALTLSTAGMEVVQASTADRALHLLTMGTFSAVVLDNHMPGRSGLEVLEIIRARPETATLPVILVTGDDEAAARVHGLRTGANDYIVKPFDPEELAARVEAQVRNQSLWGEVVDAHRRERRAIAAALASTDSDATVEDTAWLICSELQRLRYPGVAVLAVTGGGAVVPVGVAGLGAYRLQPGRPLPPRSSRYLIDRATQGPWVECLDSDVASSLVGGFVPDGMVLAVAPLHAGTELMGMLVVETPAGAGVAPPTMISRTLSECIDFAAIAAGLLGPGLARRNRSAHHRTKVQEVIDAGAFAPVFQPIVRVEDGATVGYEALTRFSDGTAPSDRFLEAGGVGLGPELELATLVAALKAQVDLPGDGFVSLNVSPTVAMDDTLGTLLQGCERPLVLELTEHDPVEDYRALREALERLTPHVHVSVDDAGAGFASLRHVVELRPEFMKLDRSWIVGLDSDPTRQALVVGLGHFARETGCRLIAEGVETPAELEVLRTFDVELGQGFLFGRPEPLTT